MKIVFRFDEDVLRQEDLQANSHVCLEMISAPTGSVDVLQTAVPTQPLSVNEKLVRAPPTPPSRSSDKRLVATGAVDAVDVIERLPGGQRAIALARGLQTIFNANSKALEQHRLATEAQEKTVQSAWAETGNWYRLTRACRSQMHSAKPHYRCRLRWRYPTHFRIRRFTSKRGLRAGLTTRQ